MQRRVLVDGSPAKIGARAFDVLLALVERRERVVPKRELMDVVWPRLVVEENNLLVHMVYLRKLLGPQAIATIPGRGYRFVMPVDAVLDSASGSEASPALRGNLPAAPPLIGRAQDLDAVTALMRDHAVVTIVGAGGIGKTRLALAAAAATSCDLPEGCWWVELASANDGAQVPVSIAAALGLPLTSGNLPQLLATALAGQRLLLVLDSCEHLAEDVAALVDQVRARAPQVRLLLTSQESLKCRDEQVFRLGALAVPTSATLEEAAQFGAVALFVERAHAVEPRFRLSNDNLAMVIDICRRLDGIALAIELAAARVPLLGVHGLHARLSQVFSLLTGGTRMKLRRHQTLRAALEWSYGLLSTEEQTAFRRLGVFADGFTLELAQRAISDARIDPWLVLDLLGHLVDKSLVIADGSAEPRYRLLETTRAFALEQLSAAGESESMLRRHAEVIHELMAATDAHCWNLTPERRRRAVQELGNLRAALDWTLADSGNRRLGYQLLGSCWLVWLQNGLTDEGLRRMQQAQPVPQDLPPSIEADFWLALARLNAGAGREEHWLAAQRAEVLYRRLDDRERLGDALLLKASVGVDLHRLPEAAQALHEAETLLTEDAPFRRQAALAATQGALSTRLGEPERAIAAFRRQGDLYRRAGAEVGEYLALGNVGSAQLEAGDVDAAIDSLRMSVEGLRRLKSPYGREFRLGMLTLALALRGDDVDTLALAREAYEQLRTLDATSSVLLSAALHHARCGDLPRAVALAGYANSALERRKSQPCAVDRQLQQRVHACAAERHPEATIESWQQAGAGLQEEQAAAIAFSNAPLATSMAVKIGDNASGRIVGLS